jgi:hypothetical protein
MGVAMTKTTGPSVVAPRRALRSDAVHHRRRGHRRGRRHDRCRDGVVVRLFVGRAASSVVVTWGAFILPSVPTKPRPSSTFSPSVVRRRRARSLQKSFSQHFTPEPLKFNDLLWANTVSGTHVHV